MHARHLRWTFIALACALGIAPAIAEAQDEFDEAAQEVGETREWDLDDGVGTDEVPWDDYDPVEAYEPHGTVHAGVFLRVAAMQPVAPFPGGPLVELSGALDVRYRWDRPWGIRFALALSYQEYRAEELGGGTFIGTSPLALRVRVMPLSVDIGRWLALRVGGDIGAQWVPESNGNMHAVATGGVSGDFVVKLFEGTVELGITGGVQTTAATTLARTDPLYGYYGLHSTGDSIQVQTFVGATLGYLFP